MTSERNKTVKTFSSFKEENKQEYDRRKKMTNEEKWREFAILQKRRWGAKWASQPIEKKVTFEKLF